MTWFADLSAYSYLNSTPTDPPTLNVGWLSGEVSFPRGDTPAEFRARLKTLAEFGRTQVTRGFHTCEFCPSELDFEATPRGAAEIRAVGADGTRFAAPSLIEHFVAEHCYSPPAEFVAAVLRTANLEVEDAWAKDLCLACDSGLRRTKTRAVVADGPQYRFLRPGEAPAGKVFDVVSLECAGCACAYERRFARSTADHR